MTAGKHRPTQSPPPIPSRSLPPPKQSVHLISRDTTLLHPILRAPLLQVLSHCQAHSVPAALYETFRSPARQDHLYSFGRTQPGPPQTQNRAWRSLHQYGLAADIGFLVDGTFTWDDNSGDWHRAVRDFCQDWKGLWVKHGESVDAWPVYERRRDELLQTLLTMRQPLLLASNEPSRRPSSDGR